jgi:hypothetical protein
MEVIMTVDKKLLAPCGLYCGVCGILIAHREKNQKLKEKLGNVYGCKAEQINCDGCMSDNRFFYCESCGIRSCVSGKGYEGCYQCDKFPCDHIEGFPVPIGKKVILRAVPQWRKAGTEAWVQQEQERYQCSQCGTQMFRGARRCRGCGQGIELD